MVLNAVVVAVVCKKAPTFDSVLVQSISTVRLLLDTNHSESDTLPRAEWTGAWNVLADIFPSGADVMHSHENAALSFVTVSHEVGPIFTLLALFIVIVAAASFVLLKVLPDRAPERHLSCHEYAAQDISSPSSKSCLPQEFRSEISSMTPPARMFLGSRAPISAEQTPRDRTHLCDDLVVPEGSQCVLALPRHVESECKIMDMNGDPLMVVSLHNDRKTKRMVLMPWETRTELATCKVLLSETIAQGLLFRTSGDLYASVKEVPRRGSDEKVCAFVVASPTGLPLFTVVGEPELPKLVFTCEDGQSRIVAALSPDDEYNQMRVAPGMDTSVVILTVLAINLLIQA